MVVTQPPLPLRVLLMLLLTIISSLYSWADHHDGEANDTFILMTARQRDYICSLITLEKVRPWQMPFCSMLLFFLANGNKTHSMQTEASLVLIEHGVYYALIHAIAITLITLISVPIMIIWTSVAYMGLHYAWHIHMAARFLPNDCTFSKSYLSLCLFGFSLGVLPLLASCDASRNLATVAHLVAWVLADTCCFLQNTLHPFFIKKTL